MKLKHQERWNWPAVFSQADCTSPEVDLVQKICFLSESLGVLAGKQGLSSSPRDGSSNRRANLGRSHRAPESTL